MPPIHNTIELNLETEVHRYQTQKIPFDVQLPRVKEAVVNILCIGNNPFRSTSGSGVIIDQKGIILTNAHIGQYVLLSEQADLGIRCAVRSGSPAQALGSASVGFIPEKWIDEHAKDILSSRARGTGEHDYALLFLTTSTGSTTLPFLPVETREPAGKAQESVLVSGYPAEFIGGSSVQSSLFPSSVITNVKDVYTFIENTVDILSLGGIALAQGGASGGAVVNEWGYLIGLISTTSDGDSTGNRDLRATSLPHIYRSFEDHTGLSLHTFLSQSDKYPSLAIKKSQLRDTLLQEVLKQTQP